MPQAIPQTPEEGVYKGQPWIVFDTVAALSFLIGDTTANGIAIGTNTSAVNAAGEMIFFNSQGRSKANFPWLTNLDIPGQLAYGLEVWAIAVELKIPGQSQFNGFTPQSAKLAESLLQFSVVELNLGQEEQSSWPATSFGNGGAIYAPVQSSQNSEPGITESLKLPEPIAMGRTQNLSCKLKIAPFMFGLIGSVAAPGVGQPLQSYSFDGGGEDPIVRAEGPFGITMKLIGRRIKLAQYGASPT